MVAPSGKFYSKIRLGFWLSLGSFILKPTATERAQVLLKSGTNFFKRVLHLRDRYVFMRQ